MENRDKIVVLLAGGRIIQRPAGMAEQVDLGEDELTALLPDDLKEHVSFQKWSYQPISNYTLRMCGEVLGMAASYVNNEGAGGVVITCGVQCISEFAYLADLVWDLNPPLIFTGSIFHAGTSDSETALRLTQSVRAAMSGFCMGKGALLCLQDEIYSPADVIRVSNFSKYGVFAFPNAPLAKFSQPCGDLMFLRSPRPRHTQSLTLPLARNIPILSTGLGDSDILLKALLDKRFEELDGLVLSGMGDGNVPSPWMPLLRKLLRSDIPIVLAARSPGGRVQATDDFEGSAKQLLEMGIIGADTLSPHQARIRLAVGLAAGLKDTELGKYVQGGI